MRSRRRSRCPKSWPPARLELNAICLTLSRRPSSVENTPLLVEAFRASVFFGTKSSSSAVFSMIPSFVTDSANVVQSQVFSDDLCRSLSESLLKGSVDNQKASLSTTFENLQSIVLCFQNAKDLAETQYSVPVIRRFGLSQRRRKIQNQSLAHFFHPGL